MTRCEHCEISIDPRCDEAHQLPDGDIVCDACHNDYLVFGYDFGEVYRERYGLVVEA